MLRIPASHWLLAPQTCWVLPGNPHPWAMRGPTLPASSWARPVYEAVVRGCRGNTGFVPHSEPTDFGPFPRSLDTAAAPASCLGGPLRWKPSDVCVCKHPELTGPRAFPSSSGQENLLPAVSAGETLSLCCWALWVKSVSSENPFSFSSFPPLTWSNFLPSNEILGGAV